MTNWCTLIIESLEDAETVIFNLKGLKYISSSGLRIFIAAMKKIKAQGGTMTIKNVDEQVKEVFEMTGFNQIFSID